MTIQYLEVRYKLLGTLSFGVQKTPATLALSCILQRYSASTSAFPGAMDRACRSIARGGISVTVRIQSWRGAVARAMVLAVITPLPAAASDSGKGVQEPTLEASMARPTLKASMEQIVVRDLSDRPAPSTAARAARQSPQANQSTPFFKSRPGMIAVAVMIAGTGYALYSAKQDRIHSAGKQ